MAKKPLRIDMNLIYIDMLFTKLFRKEDKTINRLGKPLKKNE